MADHLPRLFDGPPFGGLSFSRLFRCFRHRDDRNIGTALQTLPVLDLASNFGEQGVVLSHCDIAASMNFGAALPHQDIPGKDEFSAITLDAQTLTVGIATVTRGAACFFVSHGFCLKCGCQPAEMELIFTRVNCCRWPRLRCVFLRRFFLNATTLSARCWLRISAATEAPSTRGAPILPSVARTSEKLMDA